MPHTRYFTLITLALAGLMIGVVARSQPPPAKPSAKDLANGKRLFEGQCARCHGIKGEGGRGANLKRPVLRYAPTDKDLFEVIREGIPGTAMPRTFAMTDREVNQVIGYVRSIGRTATKPLTGDPRKGKLLYAKNKCSQCHIVDGQGGNQGPDLTDVGARRGPDFLQDAVLHPGKRPVLDADGFTAYLVVVALARDGRVLKGIRMNEDSFTIQLRDDQNRLHSLRKADLESVVKTEKSIMPEYEKTLAKDDINDLIAYLAGLQGK